MKLSRILSVLATLSLFGCASFPETLSARRVDPDSALALNPDEIFVFGRILFSLNGKRKTPYGLSKPMWQLATLENEQTPGGPGNKQRIFPFLGTDEDGAFRYAIPAGRYAITYVVPLGYTPMIDPAVEFEATKPGHAYYLGDLEVDIDSWSWLGGLWGNYVTGIRYLEVIDRFDEARDVFMQNVSDFHPAKKALLVPIKGRLPNLKNQFVPPIIHR